MIERQDNALLLARGGLLLRLHYGRNRLHYNPRVLRLNFEMLTDWGSEGLSSGVAALLAELRAVTVTYAPLLYRTTIPVESSLLGALQEAGFLETRRVYEPWLHSHEFKPLPTSMNARLELVPLAEIIEQKRQRELLDLYIEVYSRISRLDPATPEQLTAEEWSELFLEDSDLDLELSCGALVSGRLVGLTTVYEGQQRGHFELGPFGVTMKFLNQHQEMTLQMLAHSSACLCAAGWSDGVLSAEIDSDDPWTLYTCAELPFRFGPISVSLVMVPAWRR